MYALSSGSFFTNVPFPKSPYNSVKMVVYFDIINLMENYIMVIEQKIHMKNSHSKQIFNVHVKKIKMKSTQKWLWYGLMKIWLILGHSKVHNVFLVYFFLAIFLHICFFFKTCYILIPYNISQINFIHKNACI